LGSTIPDPRIGVRNFPKNDPDPKNQNKDRLFSIPIPGSGSFCSLKNDPIPKIEKWDRRSLILESDRLRITDLDPGIVILPNTASTHRDLPTRYRKAL
jgi:hypothetical protein